MAVPVSQGAGFKMKTNQNVPVCTPSNQRLFIKTFMKFLSDESTHEIGSTDLEVP